MFPELAQYVFNVATGRYRDRRTGRFVSNQQVKELVENTIDDAFLDLNTLVRSALNQNTPYTLKDLEETLVLQLRNLHVQMTLLGGGGENNITPTMWGRLGSTLREEYKYLRNFLSGIADGSVTEGDIERRMNMYGNKIWNSYWNAKAEQMKVSGFTQERRVLQPTEHCDDCVQLAGKGWQPIGTLPKPADGSTQCLSNDRCIMEFRR